MNTGLIISVVLIVITLVLSNVFGETRATRQVAKELRLIRELLERKQ